MDETFQAHWWRQKQASEARAARIKRQAAVARWRGRPLSEVQDEPTEPPASSAAASR